MLIINDNDTCSCGAYWQNNGYCANGHPRPDKNKQSFTPKTPPNKPKEKDFSTIPLNF